MGDSRCRRDMRNRGRCAVCERDKNDGGWPQQAFGHHRISVSASMHPFGERRPATVCPYSVTACANRVGTHHHLLPAQLDRPESTVASGFRASHAQLAICLSQMCASARQMAPAAPKHKCEKFRSMYVLIVLPPLYLLHGHHPAPRFAPRSSPSPPPPPPNGSLLGAATIVGAADDAGLLCSLAARFALTSLTRCCIRAASDDCRLRHVSLRARGDHSSASTSLPISTSLGVWRAYQAPRLPTPQVPTAQFAALPTPSHPLAAPPRLAVKMNRSAPTLEPARMPNMRE